MWLESHGNLARHPKTRRLMQRMGWTLPATIGNLHLLWYWALEYAPTGDFTKFDPEQLTHDLDLGGATPEQFLQALIESGFVDQIPDKSEDRVLLRLHDWPDYTAKSLRPKFRRHPERWHNVLRSYGRPIPPKRLRRTPSLVGMHLPTARAGEDLDPAVPSRAEPSVPPPSAKSTGVVGNALRAVPYIAQADSATEPDSTTPAGNAPEEQTPIPRSLSRLPGFTDAWWPKFLEMYKNQGSSLDAWEQGQALAKLAENPSTAIHTLKGSIKTLIARPELAKPKRRSAVHAAERAGSGEDTG